MKKIISETGSRVLSLPYLVAHDQGFFAEEGLELELFDKDRPAAMTVVEDHRLVSSFDGGSPFEEGETSVYRACPWGQIRRCYDSRRGGRVVSKGAAVINQAIVVRPDSDVIEPQDLANRPVGVNFHHGAHYMAIQMLEGFLRRPEIRMVHAGYPLQRFEALRDGVVDAAALLEPWSSAAEKLGYRVIIDTFYQASEVASPDMDAETYAAMNRAIKKAVRRLNEDPCPYLHYLIAEVPPEIAALTVQDLQLRRLRFVDPAPYAPEEFRRAYEWMVDWGLIGADADYSRVVDNRIVPRSAA